MVNMERSEDRYMDEEKERYRELERRPAPKERLPRLDSEEYKEEKVKEVRVKTRESLPKQSLESPESLKIGASKVIGNLFDRVKFLEQRINELNDALKLRKELHSGIITEVDTEIADKSKILTGLSDIDDIRDFKLDISNLRAEKRRESVQFWRDIVELNTQLRELLEEHQMESKISDMFKDLKESD